jgi:CubicO group peptidase (beta-lactamase class C family)
VALADIDAALAGAQTAVAGVVAMVSGRGGRERLSAIGRRRLDAPEAMTADTIFWVASFTKLVTTVAVLQLIEAGRLSLETPVAEILPAFAGLPILEGFDAAGAPRLRKARDRPTIFHLLTHTSGCGYVFMDEALARWAGPAAQRASDPNAQPRRFEAGEGWLYGVSTDWLGSVVAEVAGEGLDAVFARSIFEPLDMADTGFAPKDAGRVAAMHARLPDGSLAPMDFAMPTPPYFGMGGGGLYSTAPDYMRLLRALVDGAILSDASRASLFLNQVGEMQAGMLASANPAFTNAFDPLPGEDKRWSLGLLINPRHLAGRRSAASGAWAGLANCYYWLDPARGVAGLLLTQILPFADARVLELFAAFERAVYA